jgi:hypothetical protein
MPLCGEELGGLDSPDRVLDQKTKLLALQVGDRGTQVLDLDQPLTNKHQLSDFRDAIQE